VNINFLSWGGLNVQLGNFLSGEPQLTPVILDWQPGDIRNCSYAPGQKWIGITAEDRTRGQQVLAVYETLTKTCRILLRARYVLHHAFNRAGTVVCYTRPLGQKTVGADLLLLEVSSGRSRKLAEAVAAYGATPAWFPDDARIAYSSPGGQLEVWHVGQNERFVLAGGSAPAIHPDGSRIAFHRADQIMVFNLVDRTTETLGVRRRCLEYHFTGGLSWSPDGRYLSFGLAAGLVGKETTFFLLDYATRRRRRIRMRYQRGLILI
jgi:hypothetical protein